MSAPRIKFRDEISIVKCASSDDDDISETYATTRRNWKERSHSPSTYQRDFPHFDESSLKMRRENLEDRIKGHFRTFNYTLPSQSPRKDVFFSDHSDEISDYDFVPTANYVHVSTIGDIQPSETVSNSSREKSVSRRESLKSNTTKNESRVTCTTVNRTFQIGAPWKPKFRPPQKSVYYSSDGNRVD